MIPSPAEAKLHKRDQFRRYCRMAGAISYLCLVGFCVATLNLFREWQEPRHIIFLVFLILQIGSTSSWYYLWSKSGDLHQEYETLKAEESRKKYPW